MPTLQEILQMLEGDPEVQELEKSAEQPQGEPEEPKETEKTGEAAGIPMNPVEGDGGPGTTAQVSAAVDDQNRAGHMVTDAVANVSGDNAEVAQRVKVKGQVEEMAAKQDFAQAMVSDPDEVPGDHQRTEMGEQINLAGGVTDKVAEARVQELIELGLQKEAELQEELAGEQSYLCGQIFGHGFNDYLEGKEPAFKKEASVLDKLAEYSPEDRQKALDGMTDEEIEKVAELLDAREAEEAEKAEWYALGQAFAAGATAEEQE